ncbi:MAG: HNH endonuclease [Candidatus Poribacteria bacterium]|nr:HNH endonuclease [Candidatus Poribacteria bacterium]
MKVYERVVNGYKYEIYAATGLNHETRKGHRDSHYGRYAVWKMKPGHNRRHRESKCIFRHRTTFVNKDRHEQHIKEIISAHVQKPNPEPITRPRNLTKAQKWTLYAAQDGRCYLCWREAYLRELQVEHLESKHNDGKDILSNYKLAHPHCNQRKNGKSLLEHKRHERKFLPPRDKLIEWYDWLHTDEF